MATVEYSMVAMPSVPVAAPITFLQAVLIEIDQ
jgi:hypothetical protein